MTTLATLLDLSDPASVKRLAKATDQAQEHWFATSDKFAAAILAALREDPR